MPFEDVQRLHGEGNILATVELGVRYAEGRGVEKDLKQAIGLFEQGVEAGEPSAMFAIGVAFDRGEGLPRDEAAAVHWYQRASDLGFMEAHLWLAHMISSGRGGISPSWEAAAPIYLKAALAGHTDGQYMMGQMYTNGEGLPQDFEKAAEWYRRSSSVVPNPKSQYNLSALIRDGKVKWRRGDPGPRPGSKQKPTPVDPDAKPEPPAYTLSVK